MNAGCIPDPENPESPENPEFGEPDPENPQNPEKAWFFLGKTLKKIIFQFQKKKFELFFSQESYYE